MDGCFVSWFVFFFGALVCDLWLSRGSLLNLENELLAVVMASFRIGVPRLRWVLGHTRRESGTEIVLGYNKRVEEVHTGAIPGVLAAGLASGTV